MANLLSRMSISGQIGLVGLIGVASLVVVGAVYSSGSRDVVDAGRAVEQSNLTLAKLAAVEIDLLQARRSEKDFLLRHKEEFTQKHDAALEKFGRDEVMLQSLVGDRFRAQLDRISGAIGQYKAQFAVVANDVRQIGLDENGGLQGRLRNSVHDIEALLVSDKDDGLQASMLMMRRHEKDFFARVDGKYIDAMHEAATRFIEKLGASAAPADHKVIIATKLDAYQADFASAARATLGEADAVAQLSKSYADVEPLLEEFDQSIQERGAAEKAVAAAAMAKTSRLIGWGIVLMIGASGTLAWLIG